MQNLTNEQEYYNQRWAREEFANSLQAARCAAILSALYQVQIKNPRILDLGCGTGWLSAILGHFGPTTGVDLSDFAAVVASRKFPWVRFFQADIFHWSQEVEDFLFDVVVSQEVIEHVADQSGYLEIAARLLRNGGWLILTTPNARTMGAMRDPRAWSNQPVENILSVRDLRRLISHLFEIVEINTIISGYGEKGIYRLLNSQKIGRLLHTLKISKAYNRALLTAGFGLHTVVLARKL